MKHKIPFWFKAVYILIVMVAFSVFFPHTTMGKATAKDSIAAVNKVTYDSVPREIVNSIAISAFTGQLTGYGPDCAGCSGTTTYGYNVGYGNIYFYDDSYGNIRIVAADQKFKFGTIVRITAPNVLSEPTIAIVLDRGGKIKGNHFDLLYNSEEETLSIGRQKNVTFEVLRNGW